MVNGWMDGLHAEICFFGHAVDSSCISVDQEKMKVISAFRKENLIDNDGCIPSQQRIKYFLGMVLYYQHFIPGCSSIAKPLHALTAGQKTVTKASFGR